MKLSEKILCSLTLAGASVFAVSNILSAKNINNAVLPEGFTVTAHTGCEKTRDNSLDAITLGWGYGVDIVEFDLNFNKDGIAVLSHNEPQGNEVTLDEAFALVAGYKGLRVNVDVKNTLDLSQVVLLAEKHGILDRIFFTGVNAQFLDEVKKQTPDVTYYYNMGIDKAKINDIAYINSLIDEVKNTGAAGLNINYRGCSRLMVEEFHKAGLQVSVWTVNKRFAMSKMLAMGCDNITTRRPSDLMEILGTIR